MQIRLLLRLRSFLDKKNNVYSFLKKYKIGLSLIFFKKMRKKLSI